MISNSTASHNPRELTRVINRLKTRISGRPFVCLIGGPSRWRHSVIGGFGASSALALRGRLRGECGAAPDSPSDSQVGRAGGGRSFASRRRRVPSAPGTERRFASYEQDGRAVWSSGCEHSMETAEDRLSFLLPAFLPSFALSSALLSSVLHYFPTFFFLSLIPPALFSYPPIFYASFFTSFLSFPPSSCPSFFPSFCVLPPPAACERELAGLSAEWKKENFPGGAGWHPWFIRGRSGGGSCVILLIEGPARAVHPSRLCVRRTSFCDWRTWRAEDEGGEGRGREGGR